MNKILILAALLSAAGIAQADPCAERVAALALDGATPAKINAMATDTARDLVDELRAAGADGNSRDWQIQLIPLDTPPPAGYIAVNVRVCQGAEGA